MALVWWTQKIFQLPQRTRGWTLDAGQQRIIRPILFQTFSSSTTRPRSSLSRLRSATSDELTSAQRADLLKNWRDHPAINPKLVFPTLLVSSESLQHWIQAAQLQPYLAKPSNWSFLYQVHPRIKVVQDHSETHKLLLLLEDSNNDNVSESNNKSISLEELRNDKKLEFGPDMEIPIKYQQLSFGYILSQLLPVPIPTAYEQIGHVAHLNLKPEHIPYGELIGQVLRETNPSIDTVVRKVGEVKGKYRTYDLEVLAGPPNFETTIVEHGLPIRLNIADCYWSTRLSGERQELIQDIERSVERSKDKDLVVADVFCGVGAVCLLLAKNNPQCTILANDWNPRAIEYLKESIAQNGMEGTNQFRLTCGDAYDYLIDLGTDRSPTVLPDHILMNYPLEAPTFLGALRWWSYKSVMEKFKQTGRYPRFHVYTFARASGKDLDDEEEVAVNLVANELLPVMDPRGSSNETENKSGVSAYRREELNQEFEAKVQTRLVRDVAPGKVVVCVSFSVTPKLIRYMQGDYS